MLTNMILVFLQFVSRLGLGKMSSLHLKPFSWGAAGFTVFLKINYIYMNTSTMMPWCLMFIWIPVPWWHDVNFTVPWCHYNFYQHQYHDAMMFIWIQEPWCHDVYMNTRTMTPWCLFRFWRKKSCLYRVRQAEEPWLPRLLMTDVRMKLSSSTWKTRRHRVQQDLDHKYIS